jgi:hypothetical protein
MDATSPARSDARISIGAESRPLVSSPYPLPCPPPRLASAWQGAGRVEQQIVEPRAGERREVDRARTTPTPGEYLKVVAPRQHPAVHTGAGPRVLALARISAQAAEGHRGVPSPLWRDFPNQRSDSEIPGAHAVHCGRQPVLIRFVESRNQPLSADFSAHTW